MQTVTKRELNQRTADVLARVAEGESVVVTERGTPRWRVDLYFPSEPGVRLGAYGRLTRAKDDPAPWPDDKPSYSLDEVDALLDDARSDR